MELELDRSSSLSDLERGVVDASGLEQCPGGYQQNDRVLVLYGKGKALRTYEAKVVDVERSGERQDYLVHYNGWNTRYDEWIDSSRIAGKITGSVKSRPHIYSKVSIIIYSPQLVVACHLLLLWRGVGCCYCCCGKVVMLIYGEVVRLTVWRGYEVEIVVERL